MDYEFTSVLDLKARIKPALDSKVKEMQRKNISKRIYILFSMESTKNLTINKTH